MWLYYIIASRPKKSRGTLTRSVEITLDQSAMQFVTLHFHLDGKTKKLKLRFHEFHSLINL